MSLTRSGLHHPVLPIKTIPPWIVLNNWQERATSPFQRKTTPEHHSFWLWKKILDLCPENTPSHQASQIQVFNY